MPNRQSKMEGSIGNVTIIKHVLIWQTMNKNAKIFFNYKDT